jgi:hypothetical protein
LPENAGNAWMTIAQDYEIVNLSEFSVKQLRVIPGH